MLARNMLVALVCTTLILPAGAQNRIDDRLTESAEVLREILAKPDETPKALLNRAVCVPFSPSVRKVGLGIGVT